MSRKTPLTIEQKQEIWERHQKGDRPKDIAVALGITPQCVNANIHKLKEEKMTPEEREERKKFKEAPNLCKTCKFSIGDRGETYKCKKTGQRYKKVIKCPTYAEIEMLPWFNCSEGWILAHPFWWVEYTAKQVHKQYFIDEQDAEFRLYLMEQIIAGWVADNPYTFLNLMNKVLERWERLKEQEDR